MPNNYGFSLVPGEDGVIKLKYTEPPRPVHHTPAGEALREKFRRVYDEGHNAHYVYEKDEDVYARIQSYKDSCLIDNIIRRYQNGDTAALERMSGMYGDFSRSIDLRAAHQISNQARSIFDALTQEEKDLYNNDYQSFMGSIGTDQGLQEFVRRRVKPTEPTTPKQEVTPNAE